jgi:transcriptional regulator with XRE-family HTH domain
MSRPRGTATTPLAAYLRELRERAGLTTVEVARLSGRSRTTCYRVEQGTSADPWLVIDFARACGATNDEIKTSLVLLSRQRGSIPLPEKCTDSSIFGALDYLWSGR